MHNGYAADAVSYAAGIVLLLLLVAVLCAIVVASLFRVFSVSAEIPGLVPKIIAISVIHHENPAGVVTYSDRLYLIHVGTPVLALSGHSVEVYCKRHKATGDN